MGAQMLHMKHSRQVLHETKPRQGVACKEAHRTPMALQGLRERRSASKTC